MDRSCIVASVLTLLFLAHQTAPALANECETTFTIKDFTTNYYADQPVPVNGSDCRGWCERNVTCTGFNLNLINGSCQYTTVSYVALQSDVTTEYYTLEYRCPKYYTCNDSKCVNGDCVSLAQGSECTCAQGWTGWFCESPIVSEIAVPAPKPPSIVTPMPTPEDEEEVDWLVDDVIAMAATAVLVMAIFFTIVAIWATTPRRQKP